MKRREFLQGMVVAIAALVLPPGKAEPVVRVPHTAGRTVLDNFGISSRDVWALYDEMGKWRGDMVIEGSFIKRIPISQEILNDCIAGGFSLAGSAVIWV